MSVSRPETPSRADFFVHPDYHRLTGELMTDEIRRYEEALIERVGASSLPILVHDPHPSVKYGEFWNLFPNEQRFQTNWSMGTLKRDVAENGLNQLLYEHRVLEGVVHGSYLAQCVRTFKEGLCARPNGAIYYHHPYSDQRDQEHINPSSVKFGIVLGDHTRYHALFQLPEPGIDLPPEYADDAQVFYTGHQVPVGR